MTYDELKTKIAEAIKPNGNQEITAQVLQDTLIAMTDHESAVSDGIEEKIPTKVSQLANDSSYQTKTDIDAAIAVVNARIGSVVSSVEGLGNELSDVEESVEKNTKDISILGAALGEPTLAYGVEWDTTVSSTAMTRIGNLSLHRTLPIQKKMRGCLLDDDGNVVEYLPEDDWTGATLDGSKGQVMVEIPMHYRKFETIGDIRRCWLSEYPVTGYHKVPKMYISAYEATIQRSTSKLASVMNNSTDYRGGNNNSNWDGTYRSQLGLPATYLKLGDFRSYARKRKPSTTEWNCLAYDTYKALFWLFYVEYANRNCQLDVNTQKDGNSFAQGGLGKGLTTLLDAEVSSIFANAPIVPCGASNSLGNMTGEVAYNVQKEDGSVLRTVYVNRYRGVEIPFGHLWKIVDGILVEVNPNTSDGGDGISRVYIANRPSDYNDEGQGYSLVGNTGRSTGFVVDLGENGEIYPSRTGGSSSTHWGDLLYTRETAEVNKRIIFSSGRIQDGENAGLAYFGAYYSASFAYINIGTRLCFIPEK